MALRYNMGVGGWVGGGGGWGGVGVGGWGGGGGGVGGGGGGGVGGWGVGGGGASDTMNVEQASITIKQKAKECHNATQYHSIILVLVTWS